LTLARVGLREGNVEAVRRFAQGARNLGLEMGDEARELSAIHCLAEGARIGGDYQLARSLYDESLARNRSRGNRRLVSVELTNLAAVEKREGNLGQAEVNLREAMTISREINNSYILAANLITLAAVKMAAGQARQAARLLGHADAIYLATGLVVDPADKADYDQALTNARSELGEAAFAAAHADGVASSIDRLIATL
jgi:tetratricopeptide (TPR) repeat protein